MSDTVSTSPNSTSRRALIGGLALGAAAVVAENVKPSAAQAANGQPVYIGLGNSGAEATNLTNVGTTGGSGDALIVAGNTVGGSGLIAYSRGREPAVSCVAGGASNGVDGLTDDSGSSGVYGHNNGGGYGVTGRSAAANGIGVYGEALGTGGVGLLGTSGGGGIALRVDGKVEFTRSGTSKIPAGANHTVLSLFGATTSSIILATLQHHTAGFTVESAVPHSGSFTIWINKPAPTGGLSVGWFVIN